MGGQRRTQAQRRADTRAQLLAAARDIFGLRGFGGASLDEISEEAGLSRGALYYNFPGGKEDLFLALLQERIADRADAVRDMFSQRADSPEDTVRQAEAAASDASAWMVSPSNREWRLLFLEFVLHAAREPRFAREFARREQGMRDALVRVIEDRAADLGGEPPIAPEHLAIGINALANGLALDALVDPEAVPEDLFSTLISLLVRGMVAADPEASTSHEGART